MDSLSDQSIRRTLNADPNFERLRYLIVLTAATQPPFDTSGTIVENRPTFNVKQLWRVATHLGLDFERFRGAERVFRQLERSGLVKLVRNEGTDFHTQYHPTELGLSQTFVNLERLKKMQELESQARTMQITIKKQMTKPPPTIYEINLGQEAFTIGKDDDNDLVVNDAYMSRKHARVSYQSGQWTLEDLNSKNGSWKIESNNLRRVVRATLANNDLYQLGSTIIRFRQPES